MGTSIKLTKDEQAALVRQLASGFQKRLSGMSVIMFDGKDPTPAEVIARLGYFAELRDRVDQTHAAYSDAVAKADEAAPEEDAYVAACIGFVRATFGNEAAILADFGLVPTKSRKVQSVAEKAAAIAKRESTREARGTKGPAARQAIHGDVTGVNITPVTEPQVTPPQPAPTAAPAASAPIGKP